MTGIGPRQVVKPGLLPIGQQPVVGTHDTGKKAKPQDALPIVVGKALIVNKGYSLLQDGLQ